jgi:hypothetical protein
VWYSVSSWERFQPCSSWFGFRMGEEAGVLDGPNCKSVMNPRSWDKYGQPLLLVRTNVLLLFYHSFANVFGPGVHRSSQEFPEQSQGVVPS